MKREEPLEEVEYEPHTVKELLTEMKDLSELIVDLAYSAVLFGSEDIAQEVRHLESRMDALNYRIRITAMMAARTVEDAEGLSGILQVASAAENISNAAGDIVNLLDVAGSKPFLPRLLAKADEKLKQLTLPESTPLGGRTLADINMETETGMRVIAIRRGSRWIYEVDGDTRVRGGDSLLVRGTDEGFDAVRALAGVSQ